MATRKTLPYGRHILSGVPRGLSKSNRNAVSRPSGAHDQDHPPPGTTSTTAGGGASSDADGRVRRARGEARRGGSRSAALYHFLAVVQYIL